MFTEFFFCVRRVKKKYMRWEEKLSKRNDINLTPHKTSDVYGLNKTREKKNEIYFSRPTGFLLHPLK
jgi:hypothetical protein